LYLGKDSIIVLLTVGYWAINQFTVSCPHK